jgi:hypothetical protein
MRLSIVQMRRRVKCKVEMLYERIMSAARLKEKVNAALDSSGTVFGEVWQAYGVQGHVLYQTTPLTTGAPHGTRQHSPKNDTTQWGYQS